MVDNRFRWSTWLQSGNRQHPQSTHPADEAPLGDVPWLSLSSAQNAAKDATYESTEPDVGSERIRSQRLTTPQPRWLSVQNVPLVRSAEDGNVNPTRSPNLRYLPSARSAKRFVARPNRNNSGSSRQPVEGSIPRISAGSSWTLQVVAAIALIGLGFYAHAQPTRVAKDVNAVYVGAFDTDYSATAWPAVVRFLANRHISIPTAFTVSSAMHFQLPVQGVVVTNYTTSHPRMVLQGAAGATVEAAGAGTVSKVAKLVDGFMVTIDHGAVGDSQYFGLASVTVKQGEQVQTGEIVGQLPKTVHPNLGFDFVKNGTYINPNDYIQFPTTGPVA